MINDRKIRAESILKEIGNKNTYIYLGEGFSGIVYHDKRYVYKVHIPKSSNNYGEINGLWYLKSRINDFKNCKYFYPLKIISKNNIDILKYPFETSIKVDLFYENELIDILRECWERRFIFKNISVYNFRRVEKQLKVIDYEILPYTDNLFINLAARAYIYLKHPDQTEYEMNKIKRSILNNFRSEVMDGFNDFMRKIFSNIMFDKNNAVHDFDHQYFVESHFWKNPKKFLYENKIIQPSQLLSYIDNNYKKDVCLLIKTCAQDSNMIYEQTKHIIRQLTTPDQFAEKIIVIDLKKKDFLRQYSKGDLKLLYNEINRLIDEVIIDRYIELPSEEIKNINQRWFGIDTMETHTYMGIPVSSQLYAFEKLNYRYILQMDCDVMIGRENYKHSFLDDMIKALEDNTNAISVGFNILKAKSIQFTPYHAPSGGYKPEVRFALIDRDRILSSRPWPNSLVENKLKLGWDQSLHKLQKSTNLVSLRGGNRNTYFIHPQNYRKKGITNYFCIQDRVEKNILPKVQYEKFDLEGSFYDWAIPKRNESNVIMIIIQEINDIPYFHRLLESINSQNEKDFGIMVFLNGPNPILDIYFNNFLKSHLHITYVHLKIKITNLEIINLGVHYFIDNLNTCIFLVHIKDYILGKNTISEINHRMRIYKSDILIGNQVNIMNISSGLLTVDFMNTRTYESNLHIYLKVFRKILYERLPVHYQKIEVRLKQNKSNFEKLNSKYKWYDDTDFSNLMRLLIEISHNPIRFDYFNYVIDSRGVQVHKISDNINILEKKSSNIQINVIDNERINFLPNQQKIEIDITYKCNLKCIGCNRSSAQVLSNNDDMSINQIKQFIRESIELKKKWKLINILGGEPTMHSKFEQIVKAILTDYIDSYSSSTILQITTNYYSEKSRNIIEKLPKHKNLAINYHSFKKSNNIIYFSPFNDAPIDTIKFTKADYRKGCWVTSYCGIGFNKYGYYPCGVAGGIDRILGKNIGLKSLYDLDNNVLKSLMEDFCQYCGNFTDYHKNYGNFISRHNKAPFHKNVVSKTWVKLYANYRDKPPNLDIIYLNMI